MATDYFLKIDGIEGESKADGHTSEIDILSFSWGVSNTGSHSAGGGGGTGVVMIQDIMFAKEVDKSTPKLMEACAKGSHIKKATLTVRKAGGEKQEEYYKIILEDVLISSFQTSGSGAGMPLSESMSLNFSKVELDYSEQNEDGSLAAPVIFKWDVKARKTF